MGSVNVWVSQGFLNSKDSELRNMMIIKEGSHDFSIYGVDLVL
jgi:hypothetical protein